MENRLAPANVDAGDLPSGFSIADPSGTSASAEQDSQALQRQAQKDAILQQALTPDALERLRRIKVRNPLSFLSLRYIFMQNGTCLQHFLNVSTVAC